jgi:hypothetical protein
MVLSSARWLRTVIRAILLAGIVALAPRASAFEVAGVTLDDHVSVNDVPLVLNGAGVRSEYFVNVYVAALYAPQKSTDANILITEKAQRRMLMVLQHDFGAGRMLNAFHKGIVANLSEAEQTALKPRIDEYDQAMIKLKEVKQGDRLTFDLGADGGLVLSRNGEVQATIAGPGMASAMLKIWLGEHPPQDDLKKALLGQ